MMLGARGIYSWFVNFNARYLLAWYDRHRRLPAGTRRGTARQRLHAFIRAPRSLHGDGNLHAIIGKAVTAASPFLVAGEPHPQAVSPGS